MENAHLDQVEPQDSGPFLAPFHPGASRPQRVCAAIPDSDVVAAPDIVAVQQEESKEPAEESFHQVVISEHDTKFQQYVKFCTTYQTSFLLAQKIAAILTENQDYTNKLAKLEVSA